MEAFRWVTVCPKGKPDTQFILGAAPENGEKFANTSGIVLYCTDIQATYEDFISKGVHFDMPPQLMPFGEYLARFQDPDGNVFQLTECRV